MATTPPKGLWIHVDWGQGVNEPSVLGPFTGEGVIQLHSAGVNLYPSKDAAEQAPAQDITKAQGDQILKVSIAGPGIGQGFFGLGNDIHRAGTNVSGVVEIGAVLKAFFLQISRVEMWRSLGWIVLGVVLILLGAYMWLNKKGFAPDAVPIPV